MFYGTTISNNNGEELFDAIAALEQIRDRITTFASHAPSSYCTEELRVPYPQETIRGVDWAKNALAQC